MTKRNKHRDDRTTLHVDERVIEPLPVVETVGEVEGETTATVEGVTYPVVPGAKPRVYCPPACSSCTSLRPEGTNYTRTNGTETRENTQTELIIKRACKCWYCGTTWTDYEIIKH